MLERPDAEQLMGGLIQYLKSFGVPVIAPELETEGQVAAAKLLECDGYSMAPTATPEEIPEEEEAEEAPNTEDDLFDEVPDLMENAEETPDVAEFTVTDSPVEQAMGEEESKE